MSKTLKEQLGSIFINGRGEVCANLETTNSKVGVEVREKRDDIKRDREHRTEVINTKKKLQELRSSEREMEQRIKSLRSEGLRRGAGTELCAKFFAEANDVNNELRGVRKGIRKLSKKLHR
jgi:hypothetical protein